MSVATEKRTSVARRRTHQPSPLRAVRAPYPERTQRQVLCRDLAWHSAPKSRERARYRPLASPLRPRLCSQPPNRCSSCRLFPHLVHSAGPPDTHRRAAPEGVNIVEAHARRSPRQSLSTANSHPARRSYQHRPPCDGQGGTERPGSAWARDERSGPSGHYRSAERVARTGTSHIATPSPVPIFARCATRAYRAMRAHGLPNPLIYHATH